MMTPTPEPGDADRAPDSYEAAYAELQRLVSDLQDDAIPIDELTARLARAGELIRFCRERLRMTEEAVTKLGEGKY